MPSTELARWYAVRVKSNRERVTTQALRGKGLEVFLPVYHNAKGRSRPCQAIEVPVFAGYVFSRFDPHNRLPILTTPGVVHIVGIGNVPEPVDPDEMEAVFEIAKSGLKVSPHPYLAAGQKVRLESGPLRGAIGTVLQEKDGDRLIVSVSLLQRSIAVVVDPQWIKPPTPLRIEPTLNRSAYVE
jgi:transcription antitermination factor NusG